MPRTQQSRHCQGITAAGISCKKRVIGTTFCRLHGPDAIDRTWLVEAGRKGGIASGKVRQKREGSIKAIIPVDGSLEELAGALLTVGRMTALGEIDSRKAGKLIQVIKEYAKIVEMERFSRRLSDLEARVKEYHADRPDWWANAFRELRNGKWEAPRRDG